MIPPVKQEQITQEDKVPTTPDVDPTGVVGLVAAVRYAQAGRFISAVKLIETLNPHLTREQAKMIVNSFRCHNESRWPEELSLSVRCL